MIIKIRREDFFVVLKSFPTLENLYIKDFYRRHSKRRKGQNELKIILKKNKYIPSDMKIKISYVSEIIEIEYTRRYYKRYEFICCLKRKAIYFNK